MSSKNVRKVLSLNDCTHIKENTETNTNYKIFDKTMLQQGTSKSVYQPSPSAPRFIAMRPGNK
jgi:hypothetical protein